VVRPKYRIANRSTLPASVTRKKNENPLWLGGAAQQQGRREGSTAIWKKNSGHQKTLRMRMVWAAIRLIFFSFSLPIIVQKKAGGSL